VFFAFFVVAFGILTAMNRSAVVGTLAVAVTIGATLTAQAVTAQLGITEGRAREAVFDSFMAGAVSIAGKAEVFTAASPHARAAMVTAATTLARAFVETDEFKRRYADHREANGPDPLPAEQTADQVLAKQRAGFEQQVLAMRKQFTGDEITPEQKATLEEGFEAMRAQFTEMEKGPRRVELDGVLKAQRAEQVAAHAGATKDFDARFPADPRALVAMRLRQFLETTADIDFTARLVQQDKVQKFADPALEAKPGEWKMCFRAGKLATETARDFARKWLADLKSQGLD
jgi:hypothetical protein